MYTLCGFGATRRGFLARSGLTPVTVGVTTIAGKVWVGVAGASSARAEPLPEIRHIDIIPTNRKRATTCPIPSQSGCAGIRRLDADHDSVADEMSTFKTSGTVRENFPKQHRAPRQPGMPLGTMASTVTPSSPDATVSVPPNARILSRMPVKPRPCR